MPDDGHRTFWGQQPQMPWRAPREEKMILVAEDFDDDIDDEEFPLEDEPLSWEVLEEKEFDEFLKGDEEE
jgi:hypothetical protein